MFSALRKRLHLSPATMIASLALVFAMTGGAYAAKKYLITSTKQISPSVLKSLQGKAGPAGIAGTAGAQGAQGPAGPAGSVGAQGPAGARGEAGAAGTKGATGAQGKEGPAGPLLETLPAGKELKGTWSAGSYAPEEKAVEGIYNGVATASVSYVFPLSETETPITHYIKPGEATPAGCTGSASDPGADEGNLCVFAELEINAPGSVDLPEDPTIGFSVGAFATAKGAMLMRGSWAVTAG
jgi:Collagen triple helix repeat (20 copies)